MSIFTWPISEINAPFVGSEGYLRQGLRVQPLEQSTNRCHVPPWYTAPSSGLTDLDAIISYRDSMLFPSSRITVVNSDTSLPAFGSQLHKGALVP